MKITRKESRAKASRTRQTNSYFQRDVRFKITQDLRERERERGGDGERKTERMPLNLNYKCIAEPRIVNRQWDQTNLHQDDGEIEHKSVPGKHPSIRS